MLKSREEGKSKKAAAQVVIRSVGKDVNLTEEGQMKQSCNSEKLEDSRERGKEEKRKSAGGE